MGEREQCIGLNSTKTIFTAYGISAVDGYGIYAICGAIKSKNTNAPHIYLEIIGEKLYREPDHIDLNLLIVIVLLIFRLRLHLVMLL